MRVDISKFLRSWDRISDDVPKAIIEGFARIADRGKKRVRVRARSAFKLHSNYIPDAVRSIPGVRGQKGADRQMAAALKGLTGKHHDFQAAVFVRGSNSAKRSLEFMALHEFGGQKTPHEGNRSLALPRKGVTKRAFRTSRGRVKRMYQPKTLLEKGRVADQVKVKRKRGVWKKPLPFLVVFKSGHQAIAVRRNKKKRLPLDLLYEFHGKARIKKTWEFEQIVKNTTIRNIDMVLAELRKVK